MPGSIECHYFEAPCIGLSYAQGRLVSFAPRRQGQYPVQTFWQHRRQRFGEGDDRVRQETTVQMIQIGRLIPDNFSNFRMTVAENGAHLSGGKI